MRFLIFNYLFRSPRSSLQSKIVGLAVLAIAIFFSISGQAASPGALDLTFGTRGTASARPFTDFINTRAVVVQPDGKVVLFGSVRICSGATCNNSFLGVRFNTDGTLDNSFDGDGAVVTDYFGQNEGAFAAAVQADGKIVVAGGFYSIFGNTNNNILGFKIVRYMPDGSLDTTFGTAGRVYEEFNDVGGYAQSVIIQPDGKIVVAGSDQNSMLLVARFNIDGSLDTSFGTNGRIASNSYGAVQARIDRQLDGKLIIIIRSLQNNGALKLIRLNANGTLDSSFGSGGVVTSTFTWGFKPTVAIQTDGKILVSGGSNGLGTPPLIRFNADGSVDAGFVPNHGEITTGGACRSCTQYVSKILLLPDGRFYLVGGTPRDSTSLQIVVVSRYLSNGTIDSTFGFRGASILKYSNTDNSLSTVEDAALLTDGKVVIAGNASFTVGNFQQGHVFAMRITAAVTAPSMRADFDGDRKTDFSVFRPSTRFWYVLNSSNGSILGQRYGADGDVLTPGDYNYDRKTDLAVFRPSVNTWYLEPSLPTRGGNGGGIFGQSGDINVAEDYDGDGYTDLATFRPSNGTWNIRYSSFNFIPSPINQPYDVSYPFGAASDKPAPGDYDGDGRADLAVFRPSNGVWYIFRSSDGTVTYTPFGISTDKTVQGDYDGDLKTDIAVFRDGNWYLLRSSDNAFAGVTWGLNTDKPVPGDYDGDGKFDVAVFRPSEGAWYALGSSSSAFIAQQWGIAEDTPIPFTFVR